METSGTAPTPEEAAAALRDADSAGSALAGRLQLPPHFYGSIGTSTAVQIAAAAVGIARQDTEGLGVAVIGVLIWLCVSGLQIARFRSLNGVRVRGFEGRVVGGTGTVASTAYAMAFGGALWAAFVHSGWLVALFALLGGVGYAVGGRRWWAAYQRDPAGNTGFHSTATLVVLAGVLAGVAVAGVLALVLGS